MVETGLVPQVEQDQLDVVGTDHEPGRVDVVVPADSSVADQCSIPSSTSLSSATPASSVCAVVVGGTEPRSGPGEKRPGTALLLMDRERDFDDGIEH